MAASSAYARAERFTTPKQQTLPTVGPNTYDLPDSIARPLPGFAPFNSSAPRRNEKALQRIAALPSSASYFPRLQHDVPGGSSMWYTEQRFKYKTEDQPAPGDYEIRNERETQQMREKRPRAIGWLYACKVPYSLGDSPPSIPTRNNCNGYDIGPDGGLKAVEPSWHDLTLGPAFYEPDQGKDCTCERYRGCQWSNRTAKRDFMSAKEGPGPADYDVYTKKFNPQKCRDEAIRFIKRKTSKVPRYLDAISINTKRQNLPGPGYYDPYKDKDVKKKRKKPSHGFLCSAPRWKYSVNDNPGPGEYEETRRGLCAPKPGSMKDSAFLVDAPRFPKPKEDNTPSAASYSLPGMREEAIRKLGSVYSTVHPSFNNTAIRDLNFAPRDAPSFPAPGTYNVERRRCFCGPTAVFKSKTRRGPKDIKDDMINCATYNIDKPYRAAVEPRSHRYAEGEESFNATTERFGRVTDVKNRDADPHNPSAADYNLADYKPYKNRFSGTWNKAERWEKNLNTVPGPGTYTFHPAIGETCLRGTHNVTLGNPLPNRSLERPRLYLSALGKKKLRWFARPPQDYVHCP